MIKENNNKINIDNNVSNIIKVLEDNIYNKNWDDFIEIYKSICKNKDNREKIYEFI
jgi:hypothetical protein